MSEQDPFWAGSACGMRDPNSVYPSDVIGASDILTINSDLVNKIPDKSWMIFMHEMFLDKGYKSYPVPLELDLFCQFDDKKHHLIQK